MKHNIIKDVAGLTSVEILIIAEFIKNCPLCSEANRNFIFFHSKEVVLTFCESTSVGRKMRWMGKVAAVCCAFHDGRAPLLAGPSPVGVSLSLEAEGHLASTLAVPQSENRLCL